MQLIDLPEEILIMIIRKLDFCSLQSLYDTCTKTRDVICMPKVIKKCDLSCSIMSTAKTLKQPFLKKISEYLLELNMSGVPDLCKTIFITSMKKFKNLKILDVSYTNITILDLLEIYNICPTLKDITINFQFGKTSMLSNDMLLQCQSMFKEFENIHFVSSVCNLLKFKLGLYLLSDAKLHNLTFTLSQNPIVLNPKYNEILELSDVLFPNFCQSTIYFLKWVHKSSGHSRGYIHLLEKLFKADCYEFMFIVIDKFEPQVFASPIFKNLLKTKFNIELCSNSIHFSDYMDNMVFMWWDKKSVKFDDVFYIRITKQLEQYFPFYFDVHSDSHVPPTSTNCNWFYTHAIPNYSTGPNFTFSGLKKRRVGAPSFVVDYDTLFENKVTVELSLLFLHPINSTITFSPENSNLCKLTYLSLSGLTKYDSDFFKILFQCCSSLVTLNVETSSIAPCTIALSRFLPLSRSLKNIRLVEKSIDFKKIFLAFSQCETLENIHIINISSHPSDNLADPSILLEKCFRLYSIYLETAMCKMAFIKITQQFKKAKQLFNRPYLSVIVVEPHINKCLYNYDPFVKVFKLNPLKPV